MAIITEEPDSPNPQLHKSKPKPKPNKPTSPPRQPPPPSTSTPTKSASAAATTANPFQFWFYFTFIVSSITISFILLSSLSEQDPRTWFLNLPPTLRHHYAAGRTIKVQTAPNHPQVEVFSIQQGPTNSDSHVLIVHGLGCSSFAFKNVVTTLGSKNVHAIAIDLPGSGFSDKSTVVVEENPGNNGPFGGLFDVYDEIKEKGLFWGFDQLVEQGFVDFEENKVRPTKTKEVVKAIELGSEEMGKVLTQVVDSMGLAPVDLVLHDSAFSLSANWILENRALVRSVVLLDTDPSGSAFPIRVLRIPVVREIVLGFRFAFDRVVASCCMESVSGYEADAHRVLLKGRDGRRAVVGMGKNLNSSFDLSEWGGSDGVKGLPVRVIWSDKWSDEGRRIADALPQATLVAHSGGRWTQELNAEEVGESIYEFVSSLPKPAKQAVEEPIVHEHVEMKFDEATSGAHNHHHGHEGHDHHDGHAHAGYMDAYGLGHGWAQ
ncbi:hypothetical protein ABFS83_14G186700 [Erythranthe nasuta]